MIEFNKKSKILKALSHPDRLKMVIGLYHDACNVSECQKTMGLPQSTISQHLKILTEAGITKRTKKGTFVCYEVINNFVIQIINILES